jgi:hypothetical protein
MQRDAVDQVETVCQVDEQVKNCRSGGLAALDSIIGPGSAKQTAVGGGADHPTHHRLGSAAAH